MEALHESIRAQAIPAGKQTFEDRQGAVRRGVTFELPAPQLVNGELRIQVSEAAVGLAESFRATCAEAAEVGPSDLELKVDSKGASLMHLVVYTK
jgi:hypothetical protein